MSVGASRVGARVPLPPLLLLSPLVEQLEGVTVASVVVSGPSGGGSGGGSGGNGGNAEFRGGLEV